MDGTSNASSGTRRWDSWCRAARTISSSSGTLAPEPRSRRCTYLIYFSLDAGLTPHSHQHKNTIQALAWAPHGNLLASASRDQTVRVFDIRSMKEWVVLRGHKKEVCCASYFFIQVP